MTQTRINPQLVTHIKIRDCQKTIHHYKPGKYKKYFFGLFKDIEIEGYYTQGLFRNTEVLGFNMEEVSEIEGVMDLDDKLWYKPNIIIYCGQKLIERHYFNTVEKAKQYCDEVFPNVNVIL